MLNEPTLINLLLESKKGTRNMPQDFSHNDLNGQNLSCQDLSRCKFIHAQMNGAKLVNTILDGANLEYAQLSGVDLSNASLRGANLRGANLEYAQLDNTDFRGADVQDAQFKGSKGLSENAKKILKGRGAILDDTTNAIDRKWWIEKVLIPLATLLVGSGGILGIWQLSQQKPSKSSFLNSNSENTQLSQQKPPKSSFLNSNSKNVQLTS